MNEPAVDPEEPGALDDRAEHAEPTVVSPGHRPWREVARIASAVVVVIALVALAVMAIAAARYEPATQALARTPSVEPAAPPAVAHVAAPPSPPPARSAVVALPAAAPVAAMVPAPVPSPAPVPDAASPPPADLPAEPESPPVRECALGLPPPEPGGGVASLTPLVPFFGPFSAEAFTMMPAFEPAFPMFAPMLSAGETLLAQADPLLSALAPPSQEFEQTVFDLLAPFYAPYRPSFLGAEAEFAAALAPLVESMATAPGTECVVALEGMLVAPAR